MTMKTISARQWLRSLFCLLFLMLATGVHVANTSATPLPYPPTGSLSPTESKKLVNEHQNVTLIDVRTEAEYKESHVPGAKNIPVQVLADNLNAIPEGPVLLICRSGRRAQRAYELIHEIRPTQQLWYLEGNQTTLTDAGTPSP